MTIRHLRVRQRLLPWGLTVLWGVATNAIAAPRFELPPLVQPATHEHHPGKVIWADLVTPDLAGAKRFYGGLFGWTFNDIRTGDLDYSVALLDGAPVAGLVQRTKRPEERPQPAWLTFISVQDVGEARRVVLAHGGKVLSQPRSYPRRAWQARPAPPSRRTPSIPTHPRSEHPRGNDKDDGKGH
jgi:uncharacterized protein